MLRITSVNTYVPVCDDACNEKCSRFNAISNDRKIGTVQRLLPVNNQLRTANPFDVGTHALQKVAQINDFRLTGSAFNVRCSFT